MKTRRLDQKPNGNAAENGMSTTLTSSDSIFDTNPYETHPSLSPTEADVLWEYAKLSQHVKDVSVCSNCCSAFQILQLTSILDLDDRRADNCTDAFTVRGTRQEPVGASESVGKEDGARVDFGAITRYLSVLQAHMAFLRAV